MNTRSGGGSSHSAAAVRKKASAHRQEARLVAERHLQIQARPGIDADGWAQSPRQAIALVHADLQVETRRQVLMAARQQVMLVTIPPAMVLLLSAAKALVVIGIGFTEALVDERRGVFAKHRGDVLPALHRLPGFPLSRATLRLRHQQVQEQARPARHAEPQPFQQATHGTVGLPREQRGAPEPDIDAPQQQACRRAAVGPGGEGLLNQGPGPIQLAGLQEACGGPEDEVAILPGVGGREPGGGMFGHCRHC